MSLSGIPFWDFAMLGFKSAELVLHAMGVIWPLILVWQDGFKCSYAYRIIIRRCFSMGR